jgi:hydrogenase-4 component B
MSGVMVKMGVYGLVRVSLDLLGGGPPWWGGLLLALGAVSALIGVLYALMEQDLKRLLANSTVENVGIVLMGVGLGFIFNSYSLPGLASLALVAAFYHALNHATFKSLLFLGAGSVYQATGTRDMEKMGGLIRRMPHTGLFFLVGSAAISALPPLNGFASEWMIFQSLLAGVRIPHPFVAALMGIAVGVLALTGGLAAACFVKAFGISFLAMPRSAEAGQAKEASATMRAGMLILSLVCVLSGILPFWVTPVLSRSVASIPGFAPRVDEMGAGLLMRAPGTSSTISPPILALCLAAVLVAVAIGFRLFRVNRSLRPGETWGCGRVVQSARMEYTSAAFAEPLRRVFGGLFRPAQDVMIDFHPESKYFVQSIQYRRSIRTWFDEFLYEPLFRRVQALGGTARWIQSGSVHWYISYIFIALLILLLIARWV